MVARAVPRWILGGDLGPYDVPEVWLRVADAVVLDFPLWRWAWRALRRSGENRRSGTGWSTIGPAASPGSWRPRGTRRSRTGSTSSEMLMPSASSSPMPD